MSLAFGDLTTLAAAKAYVLPLPPDAVMSGLITRISRSIQTELNRSLLVPKTYSQQFNGQQTTALVLPNWPLLSLTSLTISGQTINLAPQSTISSTFTLPYGYRFQPWDGVPPGDPAVIELTGGAYYRGGNQNVVVTYKAGYQVTSEAATVPATPFHVTPVTPYGAWATDEGVVYAATGVALTAIPSGTPTIGQYVPPDPNATTPRLYYTFAGADAAAAVLLSYGFIPADLEQIALELIASRAAWRQRPGVRSQSLASQESFTYETGMPLWARRALAPYVSVVPPATGADV